jgi:hypothetical protein
MIQRPAEPDAPPPVPLSALCWMVVGVLLALAATLALPYGRYVQYQQANDTTQFHIKWVYERLHFDPTPIDVAVIGTSRGEAAVSPVELQRRLSADLGRPIHAANLSIVQMGQNLHYEIAEELFRTHPETKIVVVSVEEEAAGSHPLFRYVADPSEILAAPRFLNESYFDDLLFVPYRQISFFTQSLFPSAFGLQAGFEPARYLGADLDRTLGYRTPPKASPPNDLVNGFQTKPPERLKRLADQAESMYALSLRHVRWLDFRHAAPIEYVYSEKLAALARRHGAVVVFMHVPAFDDHYPITQKAFYARLGPYLEANVAAHDPSAYANGLHLNHRGALITSDWLADRLAPLLAKAPPK